MNLPRPLPYAPRRNRPLSLWNPLDYLVLLYWVFYFPQALRWYVETFGSLPAKTNGWQAIRQDPIQRRLALQGLVLALVIPFSFITLMRLVWYRYKFRRRGVWRGVRRGMYTDSPPSRRDAAFTAARVVAALATAGHCSATRFPSADRPLATSSSATAYGRLVGRAMRE